MREVVLLVGLPGSGKSTFFEVRFAATHTLVSKDLLGKRHRDERMLLLIAESLDAGKSVVVDNCNVTVADRELIVRAAGNIPVYAYVFPLDVEGCLKRNDQREGKKRVPRVALLTKRKHYVEPTWAEGYAGIFDVSISSTEHTFGFFDIKGRSRPTSGAASPSRGPGSRTSSRLAGRREPA